VTLQDTESGRSACRRKGDRTQTFSECLSTTRRIQAPETQCLDPNFGWASLPVVLPRLALLSNILGSPANLRAILTCTLMVDRGDSGFTFTVVCLVPSPLLSTVPAALAISGAKRSGVPGLRIAVSASHGHYPRVLRDLSCRQHAAFSTAGDIRSRPAVDKARPPTTLPAQKMHANTSRRYGTTDSSTATSRNLASI
jgi:hypothetical protein